MIQGESKVKHEILLEGEGTYEMQGENQVKQEILLVAETVHYPSLLTNLKQKESSIHHFLLVVVMQKTDPLTFLGGYDNSIVL
jgi:hypothetical protein